MRGLGNVFKGAVFIAGLVGLSASAFAQSDPEIGPTLEPIPMQVTLSRAATSSGNNKGGTGEALDTFAGYKLTITNGSTNNLNRIYLYATASNQGSPTPTKPVLWDSTSLPEANQNECTGFGTSILTCRTSLSIPPGGTATFIVVAKAPTAEAQEVVGQNIRVVWTAGGYEGNGQGNGCCGFSSETSTALIDPAFNTDYLFRTLTYVKGTGGTIFTGDQYITKSPTAGFPGDAIATRVVIPGLNLTSGDNKGFIGEASGSGPDCSTSRRLKRCHSSTITIPNVDFSLGGTVSPTNFLDILVRVDSSEIPSGTSIDSIQVTYDVDDVGSTLPVPVYMCNVLPNTYPCIVDRKELTGPSSWPGYTKDLKGDFQWLIRHFKNGRYDLF